MIAASVVRRRAWSFQGGARAPEAIAWRAPTAFSLPAPTHARGSDSHSSRSRKPFAIPASDRGTIDGEVVRVGGTDEKIPVLLEFEDQLISGCWAERSVAKKLAEYLFEPVRLHGRGKWSRDSEGVWELESFKIERFEKLDSAPLGTALAKLRLIGGEWRKGA